MLYSLGKIDYGAVAQANDRAQAFLQNRVESSSDAIIPVYPVEEFVLSTMGGRVAGDFAEFTVEAIARRLAATGVKDAAETAGADASLSSLGAKLDHVPVGDEDLHNVYDNQVQKPAIATNSTASNLVPGFNATESGIIGEAQGILNSPQLAEIQNAYETSQPITVTIGGRTIQYEPNLPASGMTMFGENGFLIGPEAFSSSEEFQQTILHELYRLNTSASAGGVSGSLATQETSAAASFAARARSALKGGFSK